MRRILPLLLAFAAMVGCQKPAPKELAVRDAWVRLAAVPGRPGAAYFTLAGSATPERLIAVESPRIAKVELHAGGMEGGMMTMKPMAGADVPADGEASFAPGGSHAMLFGVDPAIQPGGTLPLAFRFQSGKRLEAEAKVLAAGDAGPDHAAH
jgi:copper(I)-binding protein